MNKTPNQITREGGPWLFYSAIIVVLVVAFGFAAWVLNPVEEVDGPVGRGLGIVYSDCPGGWDEDKVDSEHLQVLSCIRLVSDEEALEFAQETNTTVITSGRLIGTEWVVVLNADGTFSHGYALDTAGAEFIYDESAIPGWLR